MDSHANGSARAVGGRVRGNANAISKRIVIALAALVMGLPLARAQTSGQPTIFPQLGHSDAVMSLAFSPDGKLLASGSLDYKIKLWDVASGRELGTLSGFTATVVSLVFSPDGKVLASGSRDIKLWDVASGREIRTLVPGGGSRPPLWIGGLAFSPDGKIFAAGGADNNSVALWDAASGRELRSLNRPSSADCCFSESSVAFSADGKTLTAASSQGIAQWDVASGRLLKTTKTAATGSIVVSRGGREAAAAGANNTISLWDIGRARVRTVSGSATQDHAMEFSGDGRTLAAAADDKTVTLWDVASGRRLSVLTGHKDAAGTVAFSPDGKTLASGSDDYTVKLWDIAHGRELRTMGGRTDRVYAVAFSPNGKLLASGNGDFGQGFAVLYDATNGHELHKLVGYTGYVKSLAFSPDGTLLAAAGDDGTIKFWDTAGAPRQTLNVNLVNKIAYSPNGKTIATVNQDAEVSLWDVASGQNLRTFKGHTDRVYAVVFSPDGKLLATTGADDTIKIWDVSGNATARSLDAGSYMGWSLAFSPDGKTLVSGGYNTIKVWDVASARVLRTLDGHAGFVNGLAFSPDGKILASGAEDAKIKLWDPSDGHELKTLTGHLASVTAIAFSPDGKVLLSGSQDGTTKEWDVASGKERVTLVKFIDDSTIAVTPEGFFASSTEQAEENLNVRIGNRVFGIASFRENFYRPDLVEKAFAGEDISQFGSIDRVKLSPQVEFAGLPSSTAGLQLKAALKLTNSGGGFGPLRLFWNGTVIQQDSALPSEGEVLTRNYTVPLQGGNNDLRVTAFNADGSMWSDARASVSAPMPAKSAAAHGTLHAIVVGIADFPKAPSHNLKYPAADAKLIADTLAQKAAPLFAKLDVRLLPPDQSDKAHIVGALRAMQGAARPGDEFVFYVASHGIVVDNQYYIIASDMIDPLNAANLSAHALSAKELGDLLANIHAARKLVILDTCDSGAASAALTAGPAAQRTATVLGRGFGLTVLAATASNQDALEGGTNGHGLFTYVLNDGLSGKAVDRASGIVSSFLLADYVRKQVPATAETVMHRDQQPTIETSGQSFAVTKVR